MNHILLSDLQNDAWASGHLFNHSDKLRENTFVNLEEFLGCWFVQRKHLHRRNFISFLEDHVDDLTGVTLLDGVGLDDAAGAIIECGGWAELFGEIKLRLFVEVALVGGGVVAVSHGVRSEHSSERMRGLSFGILGVSWAKHRSKGIYGVVFHELHSCNDF